MTNPISSEEQELNCAIASGIFLTLLFDWAIRQMFDWLWFIVGYVLIQKELNK